MKTEFELEDDKVEALLEEALQDPVMVLSLDESADMALKGITELLKHIEVNAMQCPGLYDMALNVNRVRVYAHQFIAKRKLH